MADTEARLEAAIRKAERDLGDLMPWLGPAGGEKVRQVLIDLRTARGAPVGPLPPVSKDWG